MKSFSGLFVAVVFLFCVVTAFPSSNLDDDAEVIVVPLEAQQGGTVNDQRIAEADNGSPFFSFAPYNPFRWNFGIFDEFHNIVRQLRERVHNVWSDVPDDKSDPSVKSNTTSRVEYIDGRKVVINDTFYTKETEFGTSVYNVRVIDFLPVNDDTTRTTAANNDGEPNIDVESVDDETDVVKSNNDDDELDKGSPEELDNSNNVIDINGDIDDIENFEFDNDNNQQQQLQNHRQHHQQLHQQQQPPPLEDEHYTNNRLEEFVPHRFMPVDNEWASVEAETAAEDESTNEQNIDMNEQYPVDLSNDIAINEIAADQGVPYDSDAEIFSIDEHVLQYPTSTAYEFVPADIKK